MIVILLVNLFLERVHCSGIKIFLLEKTQRSLHFGFSEKLGFLPDRSSAIPNSGQNFLKQIVFNLSISLSKQTLNK